jgi:hypothetical protein
MSNKKNLLTEATMRRFATLANIGAITPLHPLSHVVTEDNSLDLDEDDEDDEEVEGLTEQEAPEDAFGAEEDLAGAEEDLGGAEEDLAMGDDLGGLEDEVGAEEEFGAEEDDEDEAHALAAELLADEAVVGAVGAALAALGDITSDGSDLEDVDDDAAMGELDMGAEEVVDVPGEEAMAAAPGDDPDGALAESLVNEIALRVAKRLLRRG